MSSSPERVAEPGRPAPREGALLRGASAARATPYRQPVPRQERGPDRRTTDRRAADAVVTGGRPSFRLGDVYAEELARLREDAHAEGFAAGHAEGMAAAQLVVAEAERAARERLADTQARWERRLGTATAALGAAVAQLEQATLPSTEDLRESVLGAVLVLVEDLLGRELAVASSPALDAVRRALTLCPEDGPAVVRLHPDDLAEIPADALAALPGTVRVVGDDRVERAGALVESGTRRIDAQLSTALRRVQAVLAP